MMWPVGVLAVLSIVGGFLQVPGGWHAGRHLARARRRVDPGGRRRDWRSSRSLDCARRPPSAASPSPGPSTAGRARSPPRSAAASRGPRGPSSTSSTSTRPTTSRSTSPPRACATWLGRWVEEPFVLRSLGGLGTGVRDVSGRVSAAQTGRVRAYVLALAVGLAVLRDRLPGGELALMETTLLIFLPIGAAVALWIVPWASHRAAAGFALLVALAELALWVGIALNFDFAAPGPSGRGGHRLVRRPRRLLPGRALRLLALAGRAHGRRHHGRGRLRLLGRRERPGVYLSLLLFLEGATIGVFTAQDLILFYVFWEAMLIPLYVLIGVWGGPGRLGATFKFVAYTMAGSLLMLVAIIAAGPRRGHVRHDPARRPGNEHVDLPRLRDRVRRQGAALALPRLAARRLPRVAARGGRAPLRRDLEDRRVRLPGHRPPVLPRPRRGLAHAAPRRSRRSGSSTGRSSRSARPTCAASSPTRASRRCT